MAMVINEEPNKNPELLQKCNKEDDKALETKQIECEQRLIIEQMIRLQSQKHRLQLFLNEVQSLDSDDDDDDDDDDQS